MDAPRVLAVVLTYNGWRDTRDCLIALTRSTYPNLEILVVDNASTDGTVDKVKELFPQVRVLPNGRNLGFAEGNNVGLRAALDQKASYAFLLNNDALVAEDCIAELVHVAESQPGGALFGPMVYHADEPDILQSAGGELTRRWQFLHRGQNERDTGQFKSSDQVAWLTGCALLVRCSALRDFGLLDPSFFMYAEEADWCLQARAKGYEIWFVPEGCVWHRGVQRNYQPGPQVTYYSVRNELYILQKHHAGMIPLGRATFRDLRTLVSWTVRPRWRAKREHRDAIVQGLRDFLLHRFGERSGT